MAHNVSYNVAHTTYHVSRDTDIQPLRERDEKKYIHTTTHRRWIVCVNLSLSIGYVGYVIPCGSINTTTERYSLSMVNKVKI